jgi:hypothetical protein
MSDCKLLAQKAAELLQQVSNDPNMSPADKKTQLLQLSTSFQCVQCKNSLRIDDINAENVQIGDINQIVNCGIGNSTSQELVDQVKEFITKEKDKIQTKVITEISQNNSEITDTIQTNNSIILTNIKDIMTIGGIAAGILFLLILILIFLKIFNL